jgi:uncharacterized protein YdeI (YjbR/CyaY-like superfamily)
MCNPPAPSTEKSSSVAEPAKLPSGAVTADTAPAWRRWLQAHHAQSAGAWLVMWKRASGHARMTYDEAVEEALCFGWIDSRPNRLDADRSLLWFAPRKAGTGWSRLNRTRVERLLAGGRMTAAGLAKVEAAKRDGSWQALDEVEALVVPADLRAALAAEPQAAAHFDAFPRSAKRSILEWIGSAKRPKTRAARVAETARLARDNLRANQWRQPAAARVAAGVQPSNPSPVPPANEKAGSPRKGSHGQDPA